MDIDGIEKVMWKPYEIDIIKNNYKNISDRQIMQKFLPHRTHSAIATKRYEIGCRKSMPKHQRWTPEELLLLQTHWKNYNQKELKELFFPNKTVEQVRSAKMQRNLKKPPVWTNEERAILLDNGDSCSRRELKEKFFLNKTLDQISGMRKHLGIRRFKTSWVKKRV
tara:strand:- start:2195 stop:2692 length:498 start_codon:yes stop_codon:yes gene_type:complete